ncbi:hypothetical protein ACFY6U_51585 [Streptomyces sp. NPDC013157]|uniref:hypothetical protein n=1 Tax=unclassified Streptomyces TaxID=2593676 RepID=UPI0034109B7A
MELPDHPARWRIVVVAAAADTPLRARQVCEGADLETAPSDINTTRLKLKWLAEEGIPVAAGQVLLGPKRDIKLHPAHGGDWKVVMP